MALTDYLDLDVALPRRARPQRVVGADRLVRDAEPHRTRRRSGLDCGTRPRPPRAGRRRAGLDAAARRGRADPSAPRRPAAGDGRARRRSRRPGACRRALPKGGDRHRPQCPARHHRRARPRRRWGALRRILEKFRRAATPQEEQRFLYALAAFRQRELLVQTLARAINGERTQDAPFVVARCSRPCTGALAWEFVKTNWDTMDGSTRRPDPSARRGRRRTRDAGVERDVHAFFQARRPEFGGKTLEQYLEQLRIAVRLRERESAALTAYLARIA